LLTKQPAITTQEEKTMNPVTVTNEDYEKHLGEMLTRLRKSLRSMPLQVVAAEGGIPEPLTLSWDHAVLIDRADLESVVGMIEMRLSVKPS
jgi:hypothetical protein